MGRIVFNFKLCDNEPNCPAILKCQNKLGMNSAIIFNNKTKKIEIFDKSLCVECYDCTKVCKLFVIADSAAEEWFEEEKVRNTSIDPNFQLIDRYGAEYITNHHRISIDKILSKIESRKGYFILEIIYQKACLSEFDSIPIKELIPEQLYDNSYYKFCVFNSDEVSQIESIFHFNELPAIIFYNYGKFIGKVTGIYKYVDVKQVEVIKSKIRKILGLDIV